MVQQKLVMMDSIFLDQLTLKLVNDTSFILKIDEEDYCSDRIADFFENGKVFTLQQKLPINQIRIVKSEKAYFFSKSDSTTKRKAYLVHGNEAEVNAIDNEWLNVTYRKTTGWMQEKDMEPFFSDPRNRIQVAPTSKPMQ